MSRNNSLALKISVQFIGIVVLLSLIVLNCYVLTQSVRLLKLPHEVSEKEIIRQGARTLTAHYEALAARLGLNKSAPVRDSLAKFKFEIEQALTSEEIVHAIDFQGRNVIAVLDREEENRKQELLLQLLSKDPKIQKTTGKALVVISKEEDGTISVDDLGEVLSADLFKQISDMFMTNESWEVIEIEIIDGKPSLLSPTTLVDRLKLLQSEVDSVRTMIQEIQRSSGLAELSGTGIVVYVSDVLNADAKGQLVSDRDIRDIVNELYSAGAIGIAVGDERFIATSSIKNVGSTLLVNRVPVNVNPLEIKAIGDIDILASSLELIKNSLEPWGIRLEIHKMDSLTLPAFRSG
jgi:hypothetical protein